MKKYIFILLLINSLIPVFSQVPENNLKITYIANEGFLLSSVTKNVLIDALYSEGYGAFAVPSKEVLDCIMNNKSPFENISAYYLTHYHKDHCDPVLLNEYAGKHKNVPLVISKPSIIFIHGNCIDFILKKKQFAEITPDVNSCISKTINGIPTKAFGLKHISFFVDSIDLEENMVNTSYLIDLDGIKVFHSGDIKMNAFESYIEENKKWEDNVDVAFLYFELFESGTPALDFIIKTLNPKYIVLMHMPQSVMQEWTPKIEQLKSKFSNILLFNNSMESQLVSIADK